MSWRLTLALAAALAALATPAGAQAQVSPEQAETLGREAYRYGIPLVVIAIRRTRPAEKDVNWLPAPAGGFRLSMRLYWPKPAVLQGVWQPPPLERLP